jgi:RsiW-degrading membrane proteinase PrsW (M82 family)
VRYYSIIPDQPAQGPWTVDELVSLYRKGALGPYTPVESEDGSTRVRLGELLDRNRRFLDAFAAGPAPASLPKDDSRRLTGHLLVPWDELKSGRWLRQRRAFLIAGVGLMPLAILAYFGEEVDIGKAYWAIAVYFSLLWGGFFYHAFPAPEVNLRDAAFCLFGSALSCTVILYGVYKLTPTGFLLPWIHSPSLWRSWIGFVGGVGVAEELCKAIILIIMFRRKDCLSPHTMLFYGLMAGLGFGLFEGVRYQFQFNWGMSQTPQGYYLLNVLRLTSLPFLHAVWTGIAGHFLGFAFRYPERRVGLWIAAIGLPAVLHGTYNTFSRHGFGLFVAVFSVFALNLYMARSMELDRLLRDGRGYNRRF